MADSNSQLEKQNAELQRQIRELKEERAKDAAFLKSFCKDLANLRLLIQDLNDPTGSTMALMVDKLIVSNEHFVSLLSQVNAYKQEISELKEKIAEANGIAEQNVVLQKNTRYLETELDDIKQNASHATNQQLEAQLDASNKENIRLKHEDEYETKEVTTEEVTTEEEVEMIFTKQKKMTTKRKKKITKRKKAHQKKVEDESSSDLDSTEYTEEGE